MDRVNIYIGAFPMRVYSIFDRQLREYGNLVLGKNEGVVIRSLQEAVVGSKSTMENFPEQFDLYEVGSFTIENGVIEGVVPPRLVGCLVELLEPVIQKYSKPTTPQFDQLEIEKMVNHG